MLVEQGLELIDDEVCPLCDTTWDIAALTAHLKEKLNKASAATTLLEAYVKEVQPVVSYLEAVVYCGQKIVLACSNTEPKISTEALTKYLSDCAEDRSVLEGVCSNANNIPDAIAILENVDEEPPAEVEAILAKLNSYIDALPDPSKEDAAKEFLIIAQEKYDRCRTTKADAEAASERAELAANVFKQYGSISSAVLESIYNTVEKDFTAYYSFVNRDDEEKFEGRLSPSVGKLAFDVDFYGRGKFPPGAYHSEGHQDAMGLCLYLALMKHTLGSNFTLAVLDDVLMSVDAAHRREVCMLLKTRFPKTQFLLTTHDPVWLQFMRSENLIQGSISFGGWTVETGPQVWHEDDVWKQISDKLSKVDVPGAAATLRRYLEFISTTLADRLRAKVEYHANGQYDLGDLWPPIIQAWKARLQEAKDSAISWNKDVKPVEAMQADAKKKIAATQSEQWMINKSVHFNNWATLQPSEFEAVANAYHGLLMSMQCQSCLEYLSVSPVKGDKGSLRCGCGDTNLNLVTK
jgi:hypothetical protein